MVKCKHKKSILSIISKFRKPTIKAEFDYQELTEQIPGLYSFSSLLQAMEIFKSGNYQAIPVLSFDNQVVGYITEKEITNLIALQSTASWESLKDYTIESLELNPASKVTWESTIEDITVEFSNKKVELLPVINESRKYTGYCITTKKMVSYTLAAVKPRSVGGLATPIGVYLTDGFYSGGTGTLGLILTGVFLSLIITLINIVTEVAFAEIPLSNSVLLLFQLLLFLFILRLTPLVKYHSAEHQTIHAIERGLELTLENVKLQPKEHRRCGTGYMALLLGVELIVFFSLDYSQEINLIAMSALIVLTTILLFLTWRRLGHWLQRFLTTSKPSDKHLLSGIKAGKELLTFYKNNSKPVKVTIYNKIWKMGLIQILFAFILSSIALHYLFFSIIMNYLTKYWTIT